MIHRFRLDSASDATTGSKIVRHRSERSAGVTDEQWADWGALSDDDWYAWVKADFGIAARQPQA